jgi:hypothetical protein
MRGYSMVNSVKREKAYFENDAIVNLYSFAEKRCKELMTYGEYRRNIESTNNHEEILSKGYFQGFYEALLLIHKERQN